jgi:hypothetical protein
VGHTHYCHSPNPSASPQRRTSSFRLSCESPAGGESASHLCTGIRTDLTSFVVPVPCWGREHREWLVAQKRRGARSVQSILKPLVGTLGLRRGDVTVIATLRDLGVGRCRRHRGVRRTIRAELRHLPRQATTSVKLGFVGKICTVSTTLSLGPGRFFFSLKVTLARHCW